MLIAASTLHWRFFFGVCMKFVIEYFPSLKTSLVFPWFLMVENESDHPEYGFTFQDITDVLNEKLESEKSKIVIPKLTRVFNHHAVKSLDTYKQFHIFVDTDKSTILVKHSRDGLADSINNWLAEYKIPAQ